MYLTCTCYLDRWAGDIHAYRIAHFETEDGIRFSSQYYPFSFRFVVGEKYKFEVDNKFYYEVLTYKRQYKPNDYQYL